MDRFTNGQRVSLRSDWRKRGTISFSVPGNGQGKRHYNVQWEDGSESLEYEDDLEAS
jgi:hypothetical protein